MSDVPLSLTEKLHWPEQELAQKSVLNAQEAVAAARRRSASQLPPGVLKDIFTTGTSSYNVLLQSREEKRHPASQRRSASAQPKRCRKPSKSPCSAPSKEPRRAKALAPGLGSGAWCCLDRPPAALLATAGALPPGIAVTGNGIALTPKSKHRVRRRHFSPLPKPKPQAPPQLCRSFEKDDSSGKKFCILTAIKPTNLERERLRFFKSDYTYNPQFEYSNPSLPSVLAKHSHASDRFLKQVSALLGVVFRGYVAEAAPGRLMTGKTDFESTPVVHTLL